MKGLSEVMPTISGMLIREIVMKMLIIENVEYI